MKTKKFTLILNVDRDADIVEKTNFKTPVIGRDKIIEVAKELLLRDPEDADGNALFAAAKLFNEYIKEKDVNEEVEIAAITGSPRGGVEADKKMINELEEVLNTFPADNIILVTDGFSDAEILPVLSSRIPISSVHHVVVKHSRSVEETYAVLGRYLKMVWTERPYKLYFLGIPGIILVIVGILQLLNLAKEGIVAGMIILGGALIVKGFGIDDYISSITRGPTEEIIRLFAYIATAISLLIGSYIAYLSVSSLPEYAAIVQNPDMIWTYGAFILGHFLKLFLIALVVSAFIYAIGMLLYGFFAVEEKHMIRYIFMIISSLVIYLVGSEAAEILINPGYGLTRLVLYIGIGLGVLFTAIAITYIFTKVRGGG